MSFVTCSTQRGSAFFWNLRGASSACHWVL
eukprot:UN16599